MNPFVRIPLLFLALDQIERRLSKVPGSTPADKGLRRLVDFACRCGIDKESRWADLLMIRFGRVAVRLVAHPDASLVRAGVAMGRMVDVLDLSSALGDMARQAEWTSQMLNQVLTHLPRKAWEHNTPFHARLCKTEGSANLLALHEVALAPYSLLPRQDGETCPEVRTWLLFHAHPAVFAKALSNSHATGSATLVSNWHLAGQKLELKPGAGQLQQALLWLHESPAGMQRDWLVEKTLFLIDQSNPSIPPSGSTEPRSCLELAELPGIPAPVRKRLHQRQGNLDFFNTFLVRMNGQVDDGFVTAQELIDLFSTAPDAWNTPLGHEGHPTTLLEQFFIQEERWVTPGVRNVLESAGPVQQVQMASVLFGMVRQSETLAELATDFHVPMTGPHLAWLLSSRQESRSGTPLVDVLHHWKVDWPRMRTAHFFRSVFSTLSPDGAKAMLATGFDPDAGIDTGTGPMDVLSALGQQLEHWRQWSDEKRFMNTWKMFSPHIRQVHEGFSDQIRAATAQPSMPGTLRHFLLGEVAGFEQQHLQSVLSPDGLNPAPATPRRRL
jgi:hypothetical protein